MKILITTTSFPRTQSAWQGQFIRNLVYALAQNKQLDIFLWGPLGETPDNVNYCATNKEQDWFENLNNAGGIANLLRNKPIKGLLTSLKLLFYLQKVYRRYHDIDLIHVNWLQNSIPLMFSSRPIVVSVLGTDFHLLKFPGMVFLLRKVFKNKNTTICPNAEWMIKPLENYFGDVAKIIHVPYGIDEQFYFLNEPQTVNTPRKWLAIIRVTKDKIGNLFEWGENVFTGDDELHLLGPMQEDIDVPNWCHYHGPTNPQELIKNWLPNAAGLVTLSQHAEGLPQIILESMAANLPVIASDIPGHTTVIQHKETGWLVNSRNSFEEGIKWLSEKSNRKYVTDNAKRWVVANVGTWNDCAEKFFHLYESSQRKQ